MFYRARDDLGQGGRLEINKRISGENMLARARRTLVSVCCFFFLSPISSPLADRGFRWRVDDRYDKMRGVRARSKVTVMVSLGHDACPQLETLSSYCRHIFREKTPSGCAKENRPRTVGARRSIFAPITLIDLLAVIRLFADDFCRAFASVSSRETIECRNVSKFHGTAVWGKLVRRVILRRFEPSNS